MSAASAYEKYLHQTSEDDGSDGVVLQHALSSVTAAAAPRDLDDTSDMELDINVEANMSREDAKLFASLPPPGYAGRLKPRTASLARFYYYLNRCLDLLPYCIDALMRGLGPFLVVLAWCLFACCTWVFFRDIVVVKAWSVTTWPGCVIIPYGLFLLFHVYYNHIMAVFCKPGGVPSDWPIPPNIAELIREESSHIIRGEEFSKFCKNCVHPKTPRMHHCHVCKTCVSRMDHHCPWIGGCVGYRNYRYFYNFLFWLELGCIFLVCCTGPLIVYPSDKEYIRLYTQYSDSLFSTHEAPIFFILVLTAAAFFAVGGMLALHTYLVVTNQTTIEMYHNNKKKKQARRRGESWYNIYDLGIRRNIESILGRGPFILASLCPTPLGFSKLEGNGLQYEFNPSVSREYYSDTRDEMLMNV